MRDSGFRRRIRSPTPACAGAELLTGGLQVRVLPEESRKAFVPGHEQAGMKGTFQVPL